MVDLKRTPAQVLSINWTGAFLSPKTIQTNSNNASIPRAQPRRTSLRQEVGVPGPAYHGETIEAGGKSKMQGPRRRPQAIITVVLVAYVPRLGLFSRFFG